MAGFTLSTAAGLGFALPLIRAGASSVGASASIFGLLGALVCYGQRTGSRVVHSQAMGYAGILFLMGLIMPGVDNYAHAGGFAGGYLVARWLDPLKPERIDHLLMALILPRGHAGGPRRLDRARTRRPVPLTSTA